MPQIGNWKEGDAYTGGRFGTPAPTKGTKLSPDGQYRYDDQGNWYDLRGNPVDNPFPQEVDEFGQVYDPEVGLSPIQKFRAKNVYGQDPYNFQPVQTPGDTRPIHEQYSSNAIESNVRMAQDLMKNQPGAEAYTLNPQFYEAMGWDPSQQYQYEQDILQNRSDTQGLDAQRAALGDYRSIIDQGGLTAADRASIMESQMRREQELRGNREAIMRNAAEQGRAGGVAQMLMQGQASQGTANQRALDDMRMQAAALGRKDMAIGAMGQLGGQVQSAQDALDRFNTMSRQDVQQRNIAAQQKGVDTRYDDERSTRRDNVDLANKYEEMNKSDMYGERAAWLDKRDAGADVADQRTNYANNVKGIQANLQAQKQQRYSNYMAGASAFTNAAGKVFGG